MTIRATIDESLAQRKLAVVIRRKQSFLSVVLAGRWHISDKGDFDRFRENHLKPMIDELKRQEY